MNLPDFKGVLQKLSVLKNNSSILVAIIIAIVAIILFIPTQLISGRLEKQIEDESIKKGKSIKNMDAVSREQWKVEEQYQQSYANDANQIKQLAMDSSKRDLLSYKIFPKPTDVSALIFEEFGERFRKGVEELIAGLNASDAPTDAELQQSLQNSSMRNRFRGRGPSSGSRSSFSLGRYMRGSSFRITSDIDATIVDEICLEKAKSGLIYANPTNVSGYEFWKDYEHPGRDDAIKDCWYWQLGYWIVEDVIDTIEAMNADSKSVLTSPVKRLMRVGFTLGEMRGMRFRAMLGGRRSGRKTSEDKPAYVLSLQEGLTEPCTARVSNDNIDVVHFDLTVLVRADAVLSFMQQLCKAKESRFKGWNDQLDPPEIYKHNQITILESDMRPIDTQNDPSHLLYRYGEDAVVELDLICEYIFNKAGYDEVKPDLIKEEIKGEEKK
jgi:hypothetical protein